MVRIDLVHVSTSIFVFFHCQHYIVWRDLKPLEIKKRMKTIILYVGQKLLLDRDENTTLYHFHTHTKKHNKKK